MMSGAGSKSLSPQNKESFMQVPQWVKPGAWGAIVGAVGMMIIGFSWGGWTLDSTAKSMARDQANTAVGAVLTPLCGQEFMAQSAAPMIRVGFQTTAALEP